MGVRFAASGASIRDSHKRAIFSLYVPSLFFGIPGHAAFLLLPLCIIEIGGSPSPTSLRCTSFQSMVSSAPQKTFGRHGMQNWADAWPWTARGWRSGGGRRCWCGTLGARARRRMA